MNNATRKRICQSSLLLLVIIGIGGCIWMSFFSSKPYADIVPAGAKAVLRIDARKLADKPASASALLSLLPKPLPEGLDWQQPVYIFVTPDEYIGCVAAVSDEGLLRSSLESGGKNALAARPVEQDGRMWCRLGDGWQMTWDDDALLLLGPGTIQEETALRQAMLRMISASEDVGFAHSQRISRLEQEKGDMQLFSTLDALPAPLSLLFRLDIPAACPSAETLLFASITLEGEQASLRSRLCSENAEADAALKAHARQQLLAGNVYPASIPADALFFMAFSARGDELLKTLQKEPASKALLAGLNSSIDANALLNSVDGTVSLSISSLGKDFSPTCLLAAEADARKALADVPYWKQSLPEGKASLTDVPGGYLLATGKQRLYFGETGKWLRLSTEQDDRSFSLSPGEQPLDSREYAGASLYFRVNVEKLLEQPCFRQGQVPEQLLQMLSSVKCVTHVARPDGSALTSIYPVGRKNEPAASKREPLRNKKSPSSHSSK